MNLYDLTNGNYGVLRAISYPEYPESLIVLDVQVKAASDSEWVTKIRINGTYSGPTDIVSCEDYQIKWVINGRKLLEVGTAILRPSSGDPIRQVWSSVIAPKRSSGKLPAALDKFPPDGELISASISSFQVDGSRMSYNWEGTVRRQSKLAY
jgi:hypothetical protein